MKRRSEKTKIKRKRENRRRRRRRRRRSHVRAVTAHQAVTSYAAAAAARQRKLPSAVRGRDARESEKRRAAAERERAIERAYLAVFLELRPCWNRAGFGRYYHFALSSIYLHFFFLLSSFSSPPNFPPPRRTLRTFTRRAASPPIRALCAS